MVFVYWIGGHGVLFYFLFRNFYKQAYSNKNSIKSSSVPENKKIIVDDNENIVEYKKSGAFEMKRDSITQLNKALAKHL